MNMLRNLLISVNKSLKKIKLIDKCLIIFMIILMSQSIYNLFSHEIILQDTSSVDVIIRTTSASIFGYFLSANFIKKSVTKQNDSSKKGKILDGNSLSSDAENPTKSIKDNVSTPKNSIGFISNQTQSSNDNTGEISIENHPDETIPEQETSNQQIIIATVIGVISLIVIVIARNSSNLSETSLAPLSQMRDFVSGCVGFLLGSPTKTCK
ncbi:hypothetical protein [Clostridium uliginosum]|uniref:Uncharacterized protein n=1 Tax=Clostridium uliginosum TaxID=119641 RepID=A0A1I1GXP0_9CLOT|nr:hypothetical protein [Clostridium uliginosum]SFC16246.1 hypothetical protein SAMN05421842_10194 [Clostridium uliginosum]